MLRSCAAYLTKDRIPISWMILGPTDSHLARSGAICTKSPWEALLPANLAHPNRLLLIHLALTQKKVLSW